MRIEQVLAWRDGGQASSPGQPVPAGARTPAVVSAAHDEGAGEAVVHRAASRVDRGDERVDEPEQRAAEDADGEQPAVVAGPC